MKIAAFARFQRINSRQMQRMARPPETYNYAVVREYAKCVKLYMRLRNERVSGGSRAMSNGRRE